MKLRLSLLALASGLCAITSTHAVTFPTLNGARPQVIGHRGATGYLPEHTLESYRTGIAQGADFIEPDLVMTKDGVPIARHEPVLSGTTNVASLSKFASRKKTLKLDGIEYTDWFASDFTLAEIKELRAIQRVRSRSTVFDGAFVIPTFQEVIDLAKSESSRVGRTISIYPEIKHSTWHIAQGLPMEQKVVDILNAAGWTRKTDPVIIQSFEVANLKQLRTMTGVRLIQLQSCYDNDLATGRCMYLSGDVDSAPYDWIAAGDTRTYANQMTTAGLAEIATYADGIGPWKRQFVGVKGIDLNGDGKPDDLNGDGAVDERDGFSMKNSTLVEDAHKAGLFVHPYTMRSDWPLARNYAGSPFEEYRELLALGVDGLFTDFPIDFFNARDMLERDLAFVYEFSAGAPARHFRTASTADLAAIGQNLVGSWTRSGDVFTAWTSATANAAAQPVCRFVDSKTSRHFYSIDTVQCNAYKSAGYTSEGIAFHAVPAASGICANGTAAVNRYRRSVNGVDYERLVADATVAATLGDSAQYNPVFTKVGVAFCAAK